MGDLTQCGISDGEPFSSPTHLPEDAPMKWNKPEVEVVAVTMEVTAYVATL